MEKNQWSVLTIGVSLCLKKIIQAAMWRTEHKGASVKAEGVLLGGCCICPSGTWQWVFRLYFERYNQWAFLMDWRHGMGKWKAKVYSSFLTSATGKSGCHLYRWVSQCWWHGNRSEGGRMGHLEVSKKEEENPIVKTGKERPERVDSPRRHGKKGRRESTTEPNSAQCSSKVSCEHGPLNLAWWTTVLPNLGMKGTARQVCLWIHQPPCIFC